VKWRFWVGLVYLCALAGIAAKFVNINILATMVLALFVSILSTVTDETAQYGVKEFRGKETWQRMCVNLQWSLLTFYFAAATGMFNSLPSGGVPSQTAFGSVMLAAFTVIAGISGALIIRKFGKGGVLMAAATLPISVAFAIFLTRTIAQPIPSCCIQK
jgi:hypothetical protein